MNVCFVPEFMSRIHSGALVLTANAMSNQTQTNSLFKYSDYSTFAVPLGISSMRAEISLAFISAAVLFLPLFVFMPKIMQHAMKADADVVIEMFGKNDQVKKVFWTLFVAMAGLVLARVVDPVTVQQVVGMITGMGG
jgi:hypothetical protein